MNHTSVDQILAAVRMELEIESTQENPWLRNCINEYIREFNCFETYIKQEAELKIDTDGWICLPDNFYSLGILRAKCCTSAEDGVAPRFGYWVYVDSNTLNGWGVAGLNVNNYNSGTFQIIGNRIKLMGNFINVAQANLCYEAYNTDAYGSFHVPKDFENAVMYRIAHRYMLRHRNRYAGDVIQWYDAKSLAMFNQVKAKSVIRNFRNQRAQILDMVSALITDKNVIQR